MSSLRITEIFYSLQGEANTVGWPTVFVRLTGCPLRCVYCDSSYAFTGGKRIDFAAILEQVQQYKAKYVTVTGGEPLAQPECLQLLTLLLDKGYKVSLETSGAMSLAAVDPRTEIVMDLKTPASAEAHRNDYNNLQFLKATDSIKFVIADVKDFEWCVQLIDKHSLTDICTVLFSPVADVLEPKQLADWIIACQLPVRFQLQLHKILWGDAPGR